MPSQEPAPTTAPEWGQAGIPPWVEPISFDPATLTDGEIPKPPDLYFAVYEKQEQDEPRAVFSHFVTQILNEQGLKNGADFRVVFNPSCQAVELHQIRVWRNGAPLDRFNPAGIRVMQREMDLEAQILDGRKTLAIHMEDIQIGDFVEYAYTVHGANPVYQGGTAGSVDTGWGTSTGHFRYRMFAKPGRLQWKSHQGAPLPEVTDGEDGRTRYQLDLKHTQPIDGDPGQPPWHFGYPWIEFSSYPDWASVNQWALTLYSLDQPATEELKDIAQHIASLHEQPSERTVAALEWVQKNVRYLGLEMGESSHRPTQPSLVLERRFGDCKDKASLLTVLLKELGIEAAPVLVNSRARQAIQDWLPSPFAFDHVIVRVLVDGQAYFLDPTRLHQRGPLKEIYCSRFGFGLPIREGSSLLAEVTPSQNSLPFIHTKETLAAPEFGKAASLKVATLYQGQAAEAQRALLASSNPEHLSKQYEDYYNGFYTDVQRTGTLSWKEIPGTNRLETEETYTIQNFWQWDAAQNKWTASFYPVELRGRFTIPERIRRTSPLGLDFPLHVREETAVTLDKAYPTEPFQNKVETDHFVFEEALVTGKDGSFTLLYEYQTKQDNIPADAVAEHAQKIETIRNGLGYWVGTPDPQGGTPPAAEPFRINWTALVTSTFGLMCGTGGCFLLVHLFGEKDPKSRRARSIKGWLVLPAIGAVTRPFYEIFSFVQSAWMFNASQWQHFVVPGKSFYWEGFEPGYLAMLFLDGLTLPATLLLLFAFFKKKRFVPALYISVFILGLAYALLDFTVVQMLPQEHALAADMNTANSSSNLFRNIVATLIWVPYFCRSERVKETFLH